MKRGLAMAPVLAALWATGQWQEGRLARQRAEPVGVVNGLR